MLKPLLTTLLAVAALGLGACSYQAHECCDCMATKSTIFGACLTDNVDACYTALSKSPPDTNAISDLCNDEKNFCPDSCKDILYKK